MCGAVAIGHYDDFGSASKAFVQLGPQIEPIQGNAEIYDEIYTRYKRTFEILSENRVF
jgi:sugar (pentulose or hexulose) kinase